MHVKTSPYRFRYSGLGTQLSGEVTGDSTFELYWQSTRQKSFLQRNISLALKQHAAWGEEKPAALKPSPNVSANTQNIDKATGGAISSATEPDWEVKGVVVDGAETAETPFITSSQSELITFNMSSRSHPSGKNAAKGERTMRRSVRGILDKAHDYPGANLTLNLNSIRRKLNYRTNALTDTERLAKRQKRSYVECLCHLTIWDNRDGSTTLPLVTKSSRCRVSRTEDGAQGYYVSLELEDPFLVRRTDLEVSILDENGRSVPGITHSYFLELKIIPCTADCVWPPIPIMGRSDGNHYTPEMRKMGLEEVQGALVARYTHLPRALDPNVALSVFYVHEGRTYATKYGLQVTSYWELPDVDSQPTSKRGKGLDLDSFHVPPKQKKIYLPARRKKEQHTLPQEPPDGLEVRYDLSGTISGHANATQEFRNTVVRGYGCPICAAWETHRLQELLSHFKSIHAEYVFSPSAQRRDQKTKKLTQVEIKVDTVASVGKKEDDEAFSLDGDHSLTGEEPPLQPLFGGNKPFELFAPAKSAPRYPLASQVPDFRIPNRKKAKAVPLQTMYDEPENVWTSITHRQVSPSEDPGSDSDDEVDNSWQITAHMERLDALADEQGWSKHKRELTKRWDRHRMEEYLEHSRYVSNSLIRFVRKERTWLKNGDYELWQVFFDFLGRLKEKHVIDDNVVADVNELIFQDPPHETSAEAMEICEVVPDCAPSTTPVSEQHESVGTSTPVHATSKKGTARNAEHDTQSTGTGHPQSETPMHADSPPLAQAELDEENKAPQPQISREFRCGACLLPIERLHRDTTYCVLKDCEWPGVKYHKKCALAMILAYIRENLPLRAYFDGPLPDVTPDTDQALKYWQCRDCVLKRWLMPWEEWEGPWAEESEEDSEEEWEVGSEEELEVGSVEELREESEEESDEEWQQGSEEESEEELEYLREGELEELAEELAEELEELAKETQEALEREMADKLQEKLEQELEEELPAKKRKKREETLLVKIAAIGAWRQRQRQMEAERAEADRKGNAEVSDPGPSSPKGKEVVRDPVVPSRKGKEVVRDPVLPSRKGKEVVRDPVIPSRKGKEVVRDPVVPSEKGKAVSRDLEPSRESRAATPIENQPDAPAGAWSETPIGNTPGPSSVNGTGITGRGRTSTPIRDMSRPPIRDRSATPNRGRSPTPSRNRSGSPSRQQRMGTPVAVDRMNLPMRMKKRTGSPMRAGSPRPKGTSKDPVMALRGRASAQERAKVAAKVMTMNETSGLSRLRFVESAE
ncbi:uncharacterized protein Z520_05065 [Fonsecaea multimorphosa CBS 102226]|uniref:Polycomb protein VEFS-Box domain-containing protein n=1 Tax=Fonsecaea multimorphosa CBS 102226 TaxID=1442371 RepID=A0A0D2K8K4_9EURO|nr:uncharacterized protein Z520_05065 [Fonsecaea multimorphosa CBS 102226]KIX99489.1 hypothetical protein Z520_05065 [Fonsecaea multimorphosa CBS 102226]